MNSLTEVLSHLIHLFVQSKNENDHSFSWNLFLVILHCKTNG